MLPAAGAEFAESEAGGIFCITGCWSAEALFTDGVALTVASKSEPVFSGFPHL